MTLIVSLRVFVKDDDVVLRKREKESHNEHLNLLFVLTMVKKIMGS